MSHYLAILLLAASSAWAQAPNVTPQKTDLILEVDIRLKSPATPAGATSTVRLIRGVRFSPLMAGSYKFSVPCWNATSQCPPVAGVSIQVFAKFSDGTRRNITQYLFLCGFLDDTCTLPTFPAIRASPGQAYSFYYSRINAAWNEPPRALPIADAAPAVQ